MTPAKFEPADKDVRSEIRTHVDVNMCVEAGAGTGKTTVMVDRVVTIVASGHARMDEIAVITFTEKAAAELAGRVRQQLDAALAASTDPDQRDRLAAAIRDLNRAHIETIHAFAASLLRERPIEAKLDPGFEVLVDLPAQLEFEAAYEEWLTEEMAREPAPEALVNALNLGLDFKFVREAAEKLNQHRDLLPLPPFEPRPLDLGAVVARIGAALDPVRELKPLDEQDKAYVSLVDAIALHEAVGLLIGRSDGAARRALVLADLGPFGGGNQAHWHDADHCRRVKAALKLVKAALDDVRYQLRSEAVAALLEWLRGFVEAYNNRRLKAGTADFQDLLVWARDLVRDQREVRAYFQQRFRCILVDEFQDTDPLQVELIVFLCEDGQAASDWRDFRLRPGSLFVVGDPKQSIYRFRRADIAMYDDIKTRMFAGDVKEIVQNFRSVQEIIDWVNGVFTELIVETPRVQPKYIDLESMPVGSEGQAAVTVITGVGGSSAPELRRSEADALASVIAGGIAGKKWSVRRDDGDGRREARYGDVAVLIPSRWELQWYEEALARAGVPYRHEGGRSFFLRQEVRELIAILRAIDDPSDAVAAVAALRSSAFACSDEDLLIHREAGGAFDYRKLRSDAAGRVADALRELAAFERRRHDTPLPDLVRMVLDRTRMVEFAMLQPQGEQVAANLLKIIDQARELAAASGGGLRAFVRWLKQNIARTTDETDAPISEESDNVVRILTIHAAKGLEFPIVAFANMNSDRRSNTRVIVDRTGTRSIDMRLGRKDERFQTPGFEDAEQRERAYDEAEDVRLLYVAATRAKDMLIVPLLTLERTRAADSSLNEMLRRGRASDGAEAIDRATLQAVPGDLPIWRGEHGAKPGDVARVIEAREAWKAAREVLIDGAAMPLRIVTATSLKAEWSAPRTEEAIVRRGRAADFGSAVHAALERVDLRRPEDVERVCAAVASEEGMEARAGEMAELVRRVMDSATIARALRSRRLLREAPFSAALPDMTGLAEGRIDLLFEEDGELVIVDFKTDAVSASDVEARAEHYRRQALVYAWAARRATGIRVREVVFLFARVEGERGASSMACDEAFMAEAEALMLEPTPDLEEELAV